MEESTVSVRHGMFETKLRTDGSGDPLLFLHGAGGLRGWDPFLAALATSFTVYAPSHPGFETSSGIEHIDDIIDLLNTATSSTASHCKTEQGTPAPNALGHSLTWPANVRGEST